MAQNNRSSSRRVDAMSGVPRGEVLATFEHYPEAQELVNILMTGGVPPRAVSIVGTDVAVVERVIGKMGYGRAALSSAISGSWLGVLAGLVFVIFSPTDFVTPLVGGLFIGAGLGMVVGMVLYTLGRGPSKNFRSMQQVIARSYQVVVDEAHQGKARSAMKEAPVETGS